MLFFHFLTLFCIVKTGLTMGREDMSICQFVFLFFSSFLLRLFSLSLSLSLFFFFFFFFSFFFFLLYFLSLFLLLLLTIPEWSRLVVEPLNIELDFPSQTNGGRQ